MSLAAASLLETIMNAKNRQMEKLWDNKNNFYDTLAFEQVGFTIW